MGIVTFSDATGQFEAILFSEALNQYRDLLEPENRWSSPCRRMNVRKAYGLRIQTVQSLEEKSVQMQKALRVYVRDSGPLRTVARHLNAEATASFPSSSSRMTANARSRWN